MYQAGARNHQTALNKLHIWFRSNGMSLNSSKTTVMLVTTNKKRQRLDNEHLDLKFNSETNNIIANNKT